MITGSCLCEQVQFELTLPAIMMNNCHCSLCRKASGASFGTFVHAPLNQFKWIKGSELIKNFIQPKGNARPFCSCCGSRVPEVKKSYVTIPAGCLNQDPKLRPVADLYVASKAPWQPRPCGITFDEGAPNEFWLPYIETHQQKLRQCAKKLKSKL